MKTLKRLFALALLAAILCFVGLATAQNPVGHWDDRFGESLRGATRMAGFKGKVYLNGNISTPSGEYLTLPAWNVDHWEKGPLDVDGASVEEFAIDSLGTIYATVIFPTRIRSFYVIRNRIATSFPRISSEYTLVGTDSTVYAIPRDMTFYVLRWRRDQWDTLRTAAKGYPYLNDHTIHHGKICIALRNFGPYFQIETDTGFVSLGNNALLAKGKIISLGDTLFAFG